MCCLKSDQEHYYAVFAVKLWWWWMHFIKFWLTSEQTWLVISFLIIKLMGGIRLFSYKIYESHKTGLKFKLMHLFDLYSVILCMTRFTTSCSSVFMHEPEWPFVQSAVPRNSHQGVLIRMGQTSHLWGHSNFDIWPFLPHKSNQLNRRADHASGHDCCCCTGFKIEYNTK